MRGFGQWVVVAFLTICFMAVLLFLMISRASSHDNYSGIHNREGTPCCNGEDCRRIVHEDEVRILPEGGYVVKATGELVPEAHVADSPNGEWHICRVGVVKDNGTKDFNAGAVRCLMIPPGGM